MTDLEFTIIAICKRRGVALSKIESVAFNTLVTFGMANNTELLPTAANAFYFAVRLNAFNMNATGAAGFRFYGVMNANGSVGTYTTFYTTTFPASGIMDLEFDKLQYEVNGHSAGTFCMNGLMFKITYA